MLYCFWNKESILRQIERDGIMLRPELKTIAHEMGATKEDVLMADMTYYSNSLKKAKKYSNPDFRKFILENNLCWLKACEEKLKELEEC